MKKLVEDLKTHTKQWNNFFF